MNLTLDDPQRAMRRNVSSIALSTGRLRVTWRGRTHRHVENASCGISMIWCRRIAGASRWSSTVTGAEAIRLLVDRGRCRCTREVNVVVTMMFGPSEVEAAVRRQCGFLSANCQADRCQFCKNHAAAIGEAMVAAKLAGICRRDHRASLVTSTAYAADRLTAPAGVDRVGD